MLNFARICVPLTLNCNLHCKYCYRDKEKLDKIPDFTDDMKEYLRNLSPDMCEAVIASGGEPLLHWNKVQELFSYVPENIHKKIMSNGILLTQEIVDYINENNIELATSHDGPKTEFLRGVDILKNTKICDLVRQVKILRIVNVVTKYNTDVWECFFDTASRLKRTDFEYVAVPMIDIPAQFDLIDGFNYDEWFTTWSQFLVSPYRKITPWYKNRTLPLRKKSSRRPTSFNVLPNGIVCGMPDICSNYGTIHDDFKDIYNKKLSSGELEFCDNIKCKNMDTCHYVPICTSKHTFKWRSMILDFWKKQENVDKLYEYVQKNMSNIEKKYNYICKCN